MNGKCLLTGLTVTDFEEFHVGTLCYSYALMVGNHLYRFKISGIDSDKEEFKRIYGRNKLEINYILLNGMWHRDGSKVIKPIDIENILSQTHFPTLPNEKVELLFKYIFERQTYEGESIAFPNKFYFDKHWEMFYMKNDFEFAFYLKYLDESGLISGLRFQGKNIPLAFQISYKGVEYAIKINEEGQHSKNCFIAMSFGEAEKLILTEGIIPALEATGYTPIIINNVHVPSDRTINDEIIASIKKSKFCIADFTAQRNGVYFESGYALGRGLKVIYTCNHSDFDKSHFDTKHFSHVLYHNPSELKIALINKIEAFIND